jgi:hypothetical protein
MLSHSLKDFLYPVRMDPTKNKEVEFQTCTIVVSVGIILFPFLFFFFYQIKFRPLRHILILPPRPKFRLQVGLQNGASNGNPYGDTIHVAAMYSDTLYGHQLCLLLLLLLLILLQITCKYLQSSLYLLI